MDSLGIVSRTGTPCPGCVCGGSSGWAWGAVGSANSAAAAPAWGARAGTAADGLASEPRQPLVGAGNENKKKSIKERKLAERAPRSAKAAPLRWAPACPRRGGPNEARAPRRGRGRSGALAPAEPAGPSGAAPAGRRGERRAGEQGPAHLERSRPGIQPPPAARRDPCAAPLPARLPAAAAAATENLAEQRGAPSQSRPGLSLTLRLHLLPPPRSGAPRAAARRAGPGAYKGGRRARGVGFLSLPLQLHRAMRRRQRDAAPLKAAEPGGAPAPAPARPGPGGSGTRRRGRPGRRGTRCCCWPGGGGERARPPGLAPP